MNAFPMGHSSFMLAGSTMIAFFSMACGGGSPELGAAGNVGSGGVMAHPQADGSDEGLVDGSTDTGTPIVLVRTKSAPGAVTVDDEIGRAHV